MSSLQIPTDNFIPTTKDRDYKPSVSDDWMELGDEPVIVSTIGSRGSGKSGISDHMIKKYYDSYFTCLHLYSGRSLENLYFIVNKNCGIHFSKIKQLLKNKFAKQEHRPCRLRPSEEEKYLDLAERGGFIKIKQDGTLVFTNKGKDLVNNRLLHCKCHKAIPIILLVPDYIVFNQESVDRFNGFYWKDMEEYKQIMVDITTADKELLLQGKLLKPTYLRPKPLIKIKQFVIPSTEARREKFREVWTESVLMARDEHRVLVMSPLFFEGQDKFDTLADIARYHPVLMNLSGNFEPLTEAVVGKPYKYWTKKQRNHHKMAIFIDEARSVIPSSKMHGEKGAGSSKKEIFDKVPEMRHFKTWLHFFYQNPADVYDGVRHNDSMTIMKRTHLGLAGDYWKWIFSRVERDRWNFIKKLAPNINKYDDEKNMDVIKQRANSIERRYPEIKRYIDNRRPHIEEMESDKAYIIRYGKMRLIHNEMGSWHHKQEMESITGDTGITWKIDRTKRPVDEPKSKKEEKQNSKKKKEVQKIAYDRMTYLKEVEKKDWVTILDDMITMESEGAIYGFDFQKMKDSGDGNKKISDRYRQLKNRFDKITV